LVAGVVENYLLLVFLEAVVVEVAVLIRLVQAHTQGVLVRLVRDMQVVQLHQQQQMLLGMVAQVVVAQVG
jgi:hypothetical protein